ncbi:MAG: aminomethyl-transferring glycine dehydrogenase subunit GcvPB [Aigarchaeota archaeon]|nr:aminomethyl-transferring glycine dehydrogenase subunit GcvPB [Aigarchaeota archaeon]MCX8193239.1 aminomethyl-transferring glycine dehydrogenase subunit GcvPB [Nitrososphaeria archaeon]MDW7986379.1 aminomethyl-transferring glycine dehydrogenase subunit GcvPB [Nitrososphaerota archaeon]
MSYRQAKWSEPTVFELARHGAVGVDFPELDEELKQALDEVLNEIPEQLKRRELNFLELSELDVVRHYTRLSQMNFGVFSGMYPLGSCTMKYNPTISEEVVSYEEIYNCHPLQPVETVQGCLEIIWRLEQILKEITGMSRFSFQPAAGAQGEFLGCLIIRAYHKDKGLDYKNVMIVPDSAHGTNPASATMAGYEVKVVKSDEDGCVNISELEKIVDKRVAGIMLTNPNTLGLFEKNIEKIVDIIHSVDGLLYYDGANLNALLGKVRPADMGFDIVHLNLHKTFSTPHGGGGPGSGPVGVIDKLVDYLPSPLINYDESRNFYYLDYDRPKSIGRMKMFYGNFTVLVKAYVYLLRMGGEGLRKVAESSVLSSNYLLHKVKKLQGVTLPYAPESYRKHEFVVSLSKLYKETGVSARDVAKRLLDYGFHAPTIYFPLIVDEAFMIEPTESESKREIDAFYDALSSVINESYKDPEKVKTAPHNTSIGRIDEVRASHPKTMIPSWRVYVTRRERL